jgi:plastocyanin
MRALLALAGAALLLLLAFIAAPTVAAGDPCYHGFDIPPRSEGAETQIKVAPCAFGPTVSHVAVGSKVTFFNGPDFTHLITGANAEWGSRDVELKPNQQVAFTFTKAGVYPYACALHRGMSGAIVVGDVAAAANAAPAANSDSTSAASGSGASTSQPLGLGQVVVAGGAGMLIGGLAALGIVRSRSRREATV